jgi:RHS repeat-associated protein
VWLGDIPVATIRPGTPAVVYYVHTDHLNTPRRVTRPSDNKLMWTWYSDPFGSELPNENPASGGTFKYNLRFPGQLYDAHAGLIYNYFRDYDSVIGRYVESDPMGLNGGWTTYAYVDGNPNSFNDLLGLLGAGHGPPNYYMSTRGGPENVDAAVKEVLCKYILRWQGDFDHVYTDINTLRNNKPYPNGPADPINWNDPVLRAAENYAVAAAEHSGAEYGPPPVVHNGFGVTVYQFILKPIVYYSGFPTTRPSLDAWRNGMAGLYWYKKHDREGAVKWCTDCQH